MNVILLTTFNHPNGWEYLKALQERKISIKAVICNYNPASEQKVRHIIEERVKDHVKLLEYNDIAGSTPFYFTPQINSEHTVGLLRQLKADFVVFCADEILKPILLNLDGIKFINCHPALLPKYRGCNAMEWPIFDDEPIGSTCHVMDEGIDTGPIIFKKVMAVYTDDTYEALRARSLKFSAEVLAEGIDLLLKGKKPEPQDPQAGQYHKRMNEEQLDRVKEILTLKTYSHYTTQKEASIGEDHG